MQSEDMSGVSAVSLEKRELASYTTSSSIQCSLRCKRNKNCVDVVYFKNGVCLLLKNDTQEDEDLVHSFKSGIYIRPIVVPGIIYIFELNSP